MAATSTRTTDALTPTSTTTTATNTPIPTNASTSSDNDNCNSDSGSNATIGSSCSTPQRKPRRSSLKKPGPRSTGAGAEQRHVIFSRSRSLTECESRSRSRRDSSIDRREGQGQLCRVRSFKSTSKGLVRNGESFKSRDTKTFMSTGSVRVYRKSNLIARSDSVDSTDSSIGGSSVAESYYRVGVLGAPGVGMSTLVKQFLASDEQGEIITPGKDSKSPVTVSVLLDGEESLLEFHVHRSSTTETTNATSLNTASTSELEDDVKAMTSQDSPEDPHLTLHHCDAYTVIFALTEHASFQYGCRCLRLLREEWGTDRAITLVGNKADLVRQRRVSCKEACTLAHKYDCKYIETSAELGHQTDELLVGTLRQIRLKLSMTSQDDHFHDVKATAKKPPSHKWQRLSYIYRFLHGDSRAGDSCQDFFV